MEHVQRPESAEQPFTINSVASTNQTTQREVAQHANEASTCNNSGGKDVNPKPSDDQHEWDDNTFQQRVEAALLAQKVPIDDRQRAQLTGLLCQHEDLWISKQLRKLDDEYDIEFMSHTNPTSA